MGEIKMQWLRGIAAIVCTVCLITVILIGIGVEFPWAFCPAAGGAMLSVGYGWGCADRHNGLLPCKRKKIKIASSGYSGSKERCGDNCGWSSIPDGKFVVALSDGPGKGETAARESSRAVNAILGLLKAGTDPELALQLLNIILSMDNRKELFPTMDLAVLDPASRELYIYKVGAAPTIIKRSTGHCEVLGAAAMPMGVMENSRVSPVATLVKPGDQIIMMTDGIVDARRDDMELKWLRQRMANMRSGNHQTICDLVLREAALSYGEREKDDMTVVAFAVN